jgi:hypothetical protein
MKEIGMKSSLLVFFVLNLALGSVAFAHENSGKAPGSCKKIEQACENAGFKKGYWKNGAGLWRDCVDPLVQGVTNVPGATKPLPAVDASLVAACKAKHPRFGEGKVGSK